MHCAGCSTDKAARTRTGFLTDGTKYEYCDICGSMPAVWLPDVYLGSKGGIQTDPNLCNDKGQEIPFHTKREKAAIMRMLNVKQSDSAEHQHGSRNETKRSTYFI